MRTPSVRLVIETMSNPRVYCSWASSNVHISGPHWTRNSSTCSKRRLCLTFLGSVRAIMEMMDAFPPGASLSRRGAMVDVGFRLEAGLRVFQFFFLGLKWRAMRLFALSSGGALGGGMLVQASCRVGCLVAMLMAWGEGPSGRAAQDGAKTSLHLGAMEVSGADVPEILVFRRRHSSGLLDESSVFRYLRA